jgi:hypothetical protein
VSENYSVPVPVIVTVSNDYLPLLKVFCFLFNKNWSSKQEVYIFGFDSPSFDLPSNFNFVSLGEQKGPSYFTYDLYRILEKIDSDTFIHLVENEFILQPVNLSILADLLKDAETYDNVGRIDLTLGPSLRSHEILEKRKGYSLIQLTQEATYRVSLRLNIWKKEWMKKFLFQGLSPWDFELVGSQVALNDGYRVLATKEKVTAEIMDGVIIHRGKDIMDLRALKEGSRSTYNKGVKEEHIKEMVDLGYIKEITQGEWTGLFKIQ